MESDTPSKKRPQALVLSQVYYPDVVSVAQHVTEYSEALANAGWQVRVLCSRRAYDSPSVKYESREVRNGVEIIRLPGTGFGKKAKWRRACDFSSWFLACAARLLFYSSRTDVVIALTVPPLISFLGSLFCNLRGAAMMYWIMDLNPDEAVAAGWLREGSVGERVLSWMLRRSLRVSKRVIVLDRFMHDRIVHKGISADKLRIIPPWSHDNDVCYSAAGRDEFRREHQLDGKFVVMYSGNHSPCHPLATVLESALELKDRRDIVFAFVGGGSEFARVKRFKEEHQLSNIICLTYQPLSRLSASLSSADLHLVIMGDPFVGMIHPSKIYNILHLGIPFAYIGPERSHLGDLLQRLPASAGNGNFRHGDVAAFSKFVVASATRGPLRSTANSGLAAEFAGTRWVPALILEADRLVGRAAMEGGGGRTVVA